MPDEAVRTLPIELGEVRVRGRATLHTGAVDELGVPKVLHCCKAGLVSVRS